MDEELGVDGTGNGEVRWKENNAEGVCWGSEVGDVSSHDEIEGLRCCNVVWWVMETWTMAPYRYNNVLLL